jgi:mRNA interferase MazF
LLPIPFTDLSSSKVRPAVVVGLGTFPGDLFVVPVTSQLPNADLILADWNSAGLNVPSGIKGQICTVEHRLVRRVVGRISSRDQAELARSRIDPGKASKNSPKRPTTSDRSSV